MIRYTPEEHPDYPQLQAAMDKINEVVTDINEGQRLAENLQRCIELQRQIDGLEVCSTSRSYSYCYLSYFIRIYHSRYSIHIIIYHLIFGTIV